MRLSDDKLDLVIGNRFGRITYYENTGTNADPEFSFVTDTLGGVLSTGYLLNTGYATPHFFEEEDEIHLIIGSEIGELNYYDNISGNLDGLFDLYNGPASNLYEGERVSASRFDWNNDGLPDLIIGNYRGGLSFFRGDLTSSISEVEEADKVLIYPNPANDQLTIELEEAGNYQLRIYSSSGQLVLQDAFNTNRFQINTQSYQEGYYYIQLENSNEILRKAIVIIHP